MEIEIGLHLTIIAFVALIGSFVLLHSILSKAINGGVEILKEWKKK